MSTERLCVLQKGPEGYGFHLHSEKARPGQYVRLVEPGSPADSAGLKAGDRLLKVCGDDVRELGHQQVVGKIRAAGEQLTLEVQGPEEKTDDPNEVSEQLPASIPVTELRPRLCSMKKGPGGYGFNLHSDKTRQGQFVRAVDPDSPAEYAGLLPQDRIIAVNGLGMIGKQHADVVSAIKSGGDETALLVVDPETDSFFQECHVTPGLEHVTGPLPEKVVNGGLEKEDKPDDSQESDSALESPLPSPEPLPLTVTPQQDTAKDLPDSSPVPNSDPEPSTAASLDLNMSLALAKERAHKKRSQKKAPTMDWNKKKEVFSSL
ncbi:Na(+)/H(+) exchange regulatory cofactor NHE-RF1 isoform X2 [Bombina bombina]|uniref:Na(+)/H(+) exchange regulatory cofactor NHE-RF1 isoform X2 n=1 Tax=Bombina bombina TaxID=8345 RepID=UPI00235AFE96|nr:Na(+)/H(+) exchange regulatory cofactor NHE-RF1 isoform X2 [Bombina bombina]